MNYQPGILEPIPQHAIFLEYGIVNLSSIDKSLKNLSKLVKETKHIVGLGRHLTDALNIEIPGLEAFPDYSDNVYDIPATQHALFVILRGESSDQLGELASAAGSGISDAFALAEKTNGFKYKGGRDLTGYEYGTGNPVGEEAIHAAFVQDAKNPLNGSSFVSIQRWVHDFPEFDTMTREEQDKCIGRYQSTNERFDARRDSHVKKTAQESFDPEAFVLRRSMPWSDDRGRGLFFMAFGNSLRAFDVQMKSMMGAKDGFHDGLFDFSRPVSGGNYWCPPVLDGELDLSLALT